MRRAGALALLAGALLLSGSAPAGAHALVRSSDPASGAVLDHAPSKVVITFTERPDPKLTSIQVLDSAGTDHARGDPQPVQGQPLEIQVAVDRLPDGVYTVAWRTVSEADGHTTAGSFSFGVGVSQNQVSGATPVSGPKSPSPPPLGVAGRWALYWGLALLFAAAVARFFVFRGSLPLHRPILAGAWTLAVLGLAAMVVAEKSAAGVSFSRLFSSTSGHHLLREAAGIGAVTVALGFALVLRRAWAVALVGAAAGAAMYIHALNSHASASSPVWFNVGDQWLHLLSVATWVGGLAWLLIGLHGREDTERTAIATRFSFLAGITLAVVAATGIIRAIDEVGPPPDWGRLFTTVFGVTLFVKLALFVGLISFGARNRYVNVPGLTRGTRPVGSVRRGVTAEIVLAAGILGATGLLSELPPSAAVARTHQQHEMAPWHVVATGHDFATSVRVRLTVTPGAVGPNEFTARVTDFDTGQPVDASDVSLTFSLPGHPEIGQPTLDLKRRGTEWMGRGTVLSMFGRWDVSVVVQEPSGGVEVPLQVQTQLPTEEPPLVTPGRPGQPTLYTISLNPGGNSLQTYIDPGSAGRNTVHFTFFQASGEELSIQSARAVELTPSNESRALKLIRFDKGHFGANVTLGAGRWTFLVDASTSAGDTYTAYFKATIGSGGAS